MCWTKKTTTGYCRASIALSYRRIRPPKASLGVSDLPPNAISLELRYLFNLGLCIWARHVRPDRPGAFFRTVDAPGVLPAPGYTARHCSVSPARPPCIDIMTGTCGRPGCGHRQVRD